MAPNAPARRSRDLSLLIFIAALLGSALFIHSRAYSSNDASRLASIESLVHRGTWIIDESPFATVDKIKLGDHFYSDKPPILSLAGAGVYALLHNVFGLTLQPWGCTPERTPTWCLAVLESGEADWASFTLTLLLIVLPAALILVLIYRLARQRGFGNPASISLALVMWAGTAMLPFSTVFNNHVPAAAATVLAVYLLLTTDRPSRTRLILVGFSAMLAAAIDLSAAIFAIALGGYVFARYRSQTWWFAAGALAPLAITIAVDYQIVGSPVLPYMMPQGYAYSGSELNATLAGTRRAGDVPRYAFDLFVGERGVLVFFPIMLWYLYSALHAARSAEINVRWLARLLLIASALYALYFVLSTDNFGGYAYSPRWLLNPVLVLALFSVTEPALYRPRWKSLVFGALAVLSIASGFFGALNPWNPALPPLRLAYTAPVPASPPAVAMSGYTSYGEVPAELRALLGANNVVPRRFDARRGWVIMNGMGWYLIDNASRPIASELAGPLGLGVTGTLALRADFTPQVATWLSTFQSSAAAFGGEITLIGYRLDRAGDDLNVITAWQMTAAPRPYDQRRVVIELIDADGQVVQRNEAMAARYDSLHPGDRLIQMQTLLLNDLAPGKYRLQIGVIDSDTGERLNLPDGTAPVSTEWIEK
jgi:hypothetical protein